MSDADPCYNLVFWHFKTAFELLASIRAECSCVHSVFEVQLDGANGIVNATGNPVKESF